jgi:plasmid replication initiation protein
MQNKVLKLHSADRGIGRIRFPVELIESYFEYDSKGEMSDIEKHITEFQSELFKWGDDTKKFLKRSKSPKAKELLETYDDLFEEHLEDIEEAEKEPKEYRVIKLHSQILYSVKEELEEIDEMIETLNENDRLGIS